MNKNLENLEEINAETRSMFQRVFSGLMENSYLTLQKDNHTFHNKYLAQPIASEFWLRL